MIDFSSMGGSRSGDQELDPVEIFRGLPKPEDVNDLWESQADALRSWHARREEPDLVIKLNTGGGKTLVGLLVGESLRRERELPVLYMAPTRQLMDQALAKARELGISTVSYQASGPSGLPREFLNAEAVMISTYHALFNGRSRFGLLGRGEPVTLGACILDDAHASAGILRDIYSVSIDRERHGDLYHELAARFRRSFEKIDAAGTFEDMLAGREHALLEVPYWAWIDAADSVRDQIQGEDGEEFVFSLPLIRDHFRYCHALVSHEAFTITPLLPLVHIVPSFDSCERRVFMSATISDDGLLVRTFGANAGSVSKPITTRSVAGLGERMILAPTLSDIPDDVAFDLANELADRVRSEDKGVVVIVPSEHQGTERWAEHGQISTGDAVADAVEELHSPILRGAALHILVNRYDGIDLPHDSCRLLILDGKPRGVTKYDHYRATRLEGLHSINIAFAQRVEQGMGRGTRGSGDYCVVILLGRDLVEWVARKDTQRILTPGTRAQVALGRQIAGHVAGRSDIIDAAMQCLRRDPAWKKLHAQRIADAGEDQSDAAALVAAGKVERRAFEQLLYGNPKDAVATLQRAAADKSNDQRFKGWLLQLAARAAYHAKADDLSESLQAEAYAAHRTLLKPRGSIEYHRLSEANDQASNIVSLLEDYAIRSAVLERIDDALVDLTPDVSSTRFEEGVRRLGELLGWNSDRPETSVGKGPDNLWVTAENIAFVIECKSRKLSPLNKEEHGQLKIALEWFGKMYDGYRAIPVSIHPDGTATAASEAVSSETRVLTFARLGEIKAALKSVYRDLAFSSGGMGELRRKAAKLIEEHDLTPHGFAEHYLDSFHTP